jgi:hypothetical protein
MKNNFQECSVANQTVPGESKIQNFSNHSGAYSTYPFHTPEDKKFVPKNNPGHKNRLAIDLQRVAQDLFFITAGRLPEEPDRA